MVSHLDCEKSLKYYRKMNNSLEAVNEKGWIDGWREGWREGWLEGWREGWIKGQLQAKTEIAQKMLLGNEPIEKIMRYTGLTMSDINSLK